MHTKTVAILLLTIFGAGSAFAQPAPPAPSVAAPYFQELITVAKTFDDFRIEKMPLNPGSDPRTPFKITFPSTMLSSTDLQALAQDVKDVIGQDATIGLVRFYSTSDGKSLDRVLVYYQCAGDKQRRFIRLTLKGPQAQEGYAKKWAEDHQKRLEDRIDLFNAIGTGPGHPPSTMTAPVPSVTFPLSP